MINSPSEPNHAMLPNASIVDLRESDPGRSVPASGAQQFEVYSLSPPR